MNTDTDGIKTRKDKRLLVLSILGAAILVFSSCKYTNKTVIKKKKLTLYINLTLPSRQLVRIRDDAIQYYPQPLNLIDNLQSCGEIPARFSLFFKKPLPLNSAKADILTMLPGIGKKKSVQIANYRALHGSLSGIQELESIPGISHNLAQRLFPLVCFK